MHFPVIVITEKAEEAVINELLAPYYENLGNNPYMEIPILSSKNIWIGSAALSCRHTAVNSGMCWRPMTSARSVRSTINGESLTKLQNREHH